MTKNIFIGAHVSIAGGAHNAFTRAESVGCTAMQIFTKSSRSWFDKKITEEEIELFKKAAKKSPVVAVNAHAGYLINIGSSKPDVEKKSVSSLIDEIHRCKLLGIKYLVIHPGAHLGAGEEQGMEKISKNLDAVLDRCTGDVTILLETMAGQGTTLGSFEHINKIKELCNNKKNIAVCLDTCHVFAAGHDISTEQGYKKLWTDFDNIIGLKHLKLIHCNDCSTKFNSHHDVHAAIGEGNIPLKIFELLMNDKRLEDIPKILETPTDVNMELYAKEIKLLKAMVNN